MNFQEAMQKLTSGCRVCRKSWLNGTYLEMNGTCVNAYHYILTNYNYSCETIVSEDWNVEGMPDEMSFSEMIPYLMKGHVARRRQWVSSYIFMDTHIKTIVFKSLEETSFVPEFESFIANDWIEL